MNGFGAKIDGHKFRCSNPAFISSLSALAGLSFLTLKSLREFDMLAIQDMHVNAIRDLVYQVRELEIKYDVMRQRAIENDDYKESHKIPQTYQSMLDILESCICEIKQELDCSDLETVQEEEERRAEEQEELEEYYLNENWLREQERECQVAVGAR